MGVETTTMNTSTPLKKVGTISAISFRQKGEKHPSRWVKTDTDVHVGCSSAAGLPRAMAFDRRIKTD